MRSEDLDELRRKAARINAQKRREKRAEYDRGRYGAIKADPDRYAERLELDRKRRALKRELVFESDYVRHGLAHLLEGAVEA